VTARVGAIVPRFGEHDLPIDGCSCVFRRVTPLLPVRFGITVVVVRDGGDGEAREMGTHVGTQEECALYLDAWIYGALAMCRT
jgi:hypothetical protein